MTKVFNGLGSTNRLRVFNEHGGKPFLSDITHPNYQAGRNAIKAVYVWVHVLLYCIGLDCVVLNRFVLNRVVFV